MPCRCVCRSEVREIATLFGLSVSDDDEADVDLVVVELARRNGSGVTGDAAQLVHVKAGADDGAVILVADVPQLAPGLAAGFLRIFRIAKGELSRGRMD